MNRIQGIIRNVQSDGQLAAVEVAAGNETLTSLIVDEKRAIRAGNTIRLQFKESDTAIALDGPLPISCRNRWAGPIVDLVRGTIATRVAIDCRGTMVAALIMSDSAKSLHLEPGMRVVCFVKSSSMMIDWGEHGVG
jgi:molybdopterin-binding protein